MQEDIFRDIFLQIVALPVLLITIIFVFVFTYLFTGTSKGVSFGGGSITSKGIGNIKHMLMIFTIVVVGAIMFSFILWNTVGPFPWVQVFADSSLYGVIDTSSILFVGLLFGLGLGFLTFISKYRS